MGPGVLGFPLSLVGADEPGGLESPSGPTCDSGDPGSPATPEANNYNEWTVTPKHD